MTARETLGRASTPEGGRIELVREPALVPGDGPTRIVLYVDDLLLMSSDAPGSEITMAELSCLGLGPGARVLIGGLGLGFTLRAVLERVPADAEVVQVELLEALGRWHRDGPLTELSRGALSDPRARLVTGDIVAFLSASEPASYDAILLDVDNGPVAMTMNANGWLYTEASLRHLLALLRPAGTLVVWAAEDNEAFSMRMQTCGYEVEVVRVSAFTGAPSDGSDGKAVHVLFVGRRADV